MSTPHEFEFGYFEGEDGEKLSNYELKISKEHDFDVYDDSTVEAIVEFENTGGEWCSRVITLFNAATKQGRTTEAQNRLIQATFDYADTFEAAAAAIGTDKQIAENAIKELSNLLLSQDALRRWRLRSCDNMTHIPVMSQQTTHELALAYCDPDNDLQPVNTEHNLDPTALAKTSFVVFIEDQANSVLGSLRTTQPETKPAPSQARPRKIAQKAFGRYKFTG